MVSLSLEYYKSNKRFILAIKNPCVNNSAENNDTHTLQVHQITLSTIS